MLIIRCGPLVIKNWNSEGNEQRTLAPTTHLNTDPNLTKIKNKWKLNPCSILLSITLQTEKAKHLPWIFHANFLWVCVDEFIFSKTFFFIFIFHESQPHFSFSPDDEFNIAIIIIIIRFMRLFHTKYFTLMNHLHVITIVDNSQKGILLFYSVWCSGSSHRIVQYLTQPNPNVCKIKNMTVERNAKRKLSNPFA